MFLKLNRVVFELQDFLDFNEIRSDIQEYGPKDFENGFKYPKLKFFLLCLCSDRHSGSKLPQAKIDFRLYRGLRGLLLHSKMFL